MSRKSRSWVRIPMLVLLALLLTGLVGCVAGTPAAPAAQPEATMAPAEEAPVEEELVEVSAGWVSAVDQLGLPAAVELGFFEEHGLDVTLAEPYATGVDELNALQAGEIQFAQAGVPAIGAILSGMDLVMLGNYTGSSTQAGIDETMAMVARAESGIDPEDLTTLAGKRVGVSIGSINHLYLLGLLEEVGVSPDDVEIINTPPPEMAVALQTSGLDAVVVWDPWPVIALNDVEGTYEVVRGGGYISFIGYILGIRDWVEANPDVVTKFLAARAEADQWIRQNPDQAAELATRWLPGTELDVAEQAMQYNVRQLDPRLSACNYLALDTSQELLLNLGTIKDTIDVSQHFEPQYLLQVMGEYPQYFEDLKPIPAGAEIGAGFEYDRPQAGEVCQ